MSFNSPSLSSSDSLSGLPPKILELLSKQAEAIALQSKVLLKQHQQLTCANDPSFPLSSPRQGLQTSPIYQDNSPSGLSATAQFQSPEEIRLILWQIIAKVSGFPQEEIQLHHHLVENLGLDSWMLAQLLHHLKNTFCLASNMPIQPTMKVEQVLEQLLSLNNINPTVSLPTPIPLSSLKSSVSPQERHQTIETSPAYLALQEREHLISSYTQLNPYFRPHEGVNSNRVIIEGRELINYSSYNYVGMSGDPQVNEAAKQAIEHYGTSVCASRIIGGQIPLHQELESKIAEFIGVEDSVVYVSGHGTNVSTIGHLFGEGDLILHDALSHNSVIVGCILSGAQRQAFPHNDWQALENTLKTLRPYYNKVLIVIEGVYSMDGDIPDLAKFVEVSKANNAYLMVDEAHSLGVLGKRGKGITEYCNVDPNEVDFLMGTLSKTLASCGGYIAGRQNLIDFLRKTSPGFIFSVGIPAANAAASLEAIKLLEAEPERVQKLQYNSSLFLNLAKEKGLNTGNSANSAVVPIIVGESSVCLKLSEALFKRGINVDAILYPAVEKNGARMRFFITSEHTQEQISYTVNTLAEEIHN